MEMKSIFLDEVKRNICDWDKTDIYAISLFVDYNGDDIYTPTVRLGYNTLNNYKNEISNASSELEAKWNYAFWLQNEKLILGIDEVEKTVQQWNEQGGYTYYTYTEMFEGSNELLNEYSSQAILDAFIQVLVDIVKELHSSGFIKEQFGQEIPVIIHELEYYDKIAKQNIAANSYELVQDFLSFCPEI